MLLQLNSTVTVVKDNQVMLFQLQWFPRAETGAVPEEESVNSVTAHQADPVSQQSSGPSLQAGSQVCTEGTGCQQRISWEETLNILSFL